MKDSKVNNISPIICARVVDQLTYDNTLMSCFQSAGLITSQYIFGKLFKLGCFELGR